MVLFVIDIQLQLGIWKLVLRYVMNVRGCIQKFPDWVDNEITPPPPHNNNNNNKH
jgi:hypothetical protein